MIWHYYLDQSMYLFNLENYCEKWGLELNLGKTNPETAGESQFDAPCGFSKNAFFRERMRS